MNVERSVLRVARAVARECRRAGAGAVLLAGSHANGSAGEHSDIDLIAVFSRLLPPDADAPPPISQRAGHLVTVAAVTPASVRASFRDPARFPTYVPGWREAIVIDDSSGAASRLKRAAERWTWDSVADLADQWVAEQITGWAEEVHKLAAAIADGRALHAASQRSVLALGLAGVMAVHQRVLYGTENVLWDVVSQRMTEPWASAQARALGAVASAPEDADRAALELYRTAAREVARLLSPPQRRVVERACAIAARA